MKFVWEGGDVVPGRRLIQAKHPQLEVMIFADNAIGSGKRFGIVTLDSGQVLEREKAPTDLADILTSLKFAPVALKHPEEEDY